MSRDSTNIFHGNSSNIQIQQNTANSSQTIVYNSESIDFDKASGIFTLIRNNIDSLGVSESVKNTFIDTLDEVQANVDSKTEPNLVRQALSTVKNFLIGVSGSLAASGVLHLISTL